MSFLGNFFTNFTKGKIEDQDTTEEKIESFAPVNVEDSIVVDSGGVVSHALMYGKDNYCSNCGKRVRKKVDE